MVLLNTSYDKTGGNMQRPDFEGALKEIVALLDAANQERLVRRITEEQIQIIAVTYQVNPYTEFAETLAEFYSDYLKQCLNDKVISEAEAEDLAHLKIVLGLNDRIVEQIHEQVVQSIYNESVAEAIADGRLDAEEREFLEKLQRDLRLSNEIAQRIYEHHAGKYLQLFFESAVQDERLSPEEEQELNAITRSLGVDLNIDQNTYSVLNKYRLYWIIENGRLPELHNVPLELAAGERCYLSVEVDWYERERQALVERIGNIRFFKANYQPLQGVEEQPILDEWQAIDRGVAYLTNRRVALRGSTTSEDIDLQRILDVRPYQQGLEIICRTGPSPYLAFEHGVDIFLVLLGRAIRDLS
ncbi:MAG: hypothetical protein CUN55_08705 [Phototrophicales bacterium]|nr:MAG: hypothetical protein CUN55_08705 [Phototrophicales bacterium]